MFKGINNGINHGRSSDLELVIIRIKNHTYIWEGSVNKEGIIWQIQLLQDH